MAIVFLFIGIAAVAVGVRGQASAAGQLLASEFTGPNSYIEWFAAIVILGVLGFVKPIRPAANAMLGLVILAMFLKKGQGFFDQINSALTNATPASSPSAQTSAYGALQGQSPSQLQGQGEPVVAGTPPATALPGGPIFNLDIFDPSNPNSIYPWNLGHALN